MEKMKETILDQLKEIEKKEQVHILFAAESGSRAWGIDSPDSDYDVRFVYARTKEQYLVIKEPRDVIEWQLDEILDINGWDIKKALLQFYRGNATLFEWSNSPIIYYTSNLWEEIYKTSRMYFSVKAALFHYYGIANNTYHHFLKGEMIKDKKYFYALRPLLAGIYIREKRCPPPVEFSELIKMDLDCALKEEIEKLLERKRQRMEAEEGKPMHLIQNFIETQLPKQKAYAEGMPDDKKKDCAPLNQLFQNTIDSFDS